MSVTPRAPGGPTAYLGERIDRASQPSAAMRGLAEHLPANGVATYRPATAWSGGIYSPHVVEAVNRAALLASDVMVADFLDQGSTYGLPMEVAAASAAGIPVVALWPEHVAYSVSLQATPGLTFATGWREAIDLIADQAQAHRAQAAFRAPRAPWKFTMAAGQAPPRQALADDAGVDLVTSVDTEIPPHSFRDIPTTTLGVQIPEGMWALITGRSSAIRKLGLLVPSGVIDHGWRGPLMAGVYNLTSETVTVRRGDRVAQAILLPNLTETVDIVQVDQVDPHERGTQGFGSTGGVTVGSTREVTTASTEALRSVLSGQTAEQWRERHSVTLDDGQAIYADVPGDWMDHPDELDGAQETAAILADPQTMAAIAEGQADIAAGRVTRLNTPAGLTRWGLTDEQIDAMPWASEGERMQALDGPGAKPADAWIAPGGWAHPPAVPVELTAEDRARIADGTTLTYPGPFTVTDSDGRQSVASEIRIIPLPSAEKPPVDSYYTNDGTDAPQPVWTPKQIQTAEQEQAEYDRIEAEGRVNPDAWS